MARDESVSPDHRQMAVDTFNATWEFMDKELRTAEENDMMVHAAHASRYHWSRAGGPVESGRGDWQLSRVYSILGKGTEALHYAKHSLNTCLENEIGDLDLAFAYEALARAHAVLGNWEESDRYVQNAKRAAESIAKDEDRQYLLGELDGIPRMP